MYCQQKTNHRNHYRSKNPKGLRNYLGQRTRNGIAVNMHGHGAAAWVRLVMQALSASKVVDG